MSEDTKRKKPLAHAAANQSTKVSKDPDDDRETLPADTPWNYLTKVHQKRDKGKPHKTMVQFPPTKKSPLDVESSRHVKLTLSARFSGAVLVSMPINRCWAAAVLFAQLV